MKSLFISIGQYLDGDSNRCNELGELRDASRSVTDDHIESDQSSISSQTSVQTSSQQSCVNVASTQGKNNPECCDCWCISEKKNYTIQVQSPKFKSKVLFQSLIPKDWHLE